MQKNLIALCLLALTSLAVSARADPAVKFPQNSDRLESTGPLPIHASSPDAELGSAGIRTGWVQDGDSVTVVSLKLVSTVFGFDVWIEVETSDGAQGWVDDGTSSDVLAGHGFLKRPANPSAVLAHGD